MINIAEVPHNIEAEAAALGSVLINPACMPTVSAVMRPDDLYILRYQHIYRAMLDLAEQKLPIDLVTLADRLTALGKLEAIGGPAEIAKLANAVPTSVNAEFYAQLVVAKAQRRALLKFTDVVRAGALDESTSVFDVLSTAERDLRTVMERRTVKAAAVSAADVVEQQFQLIEQATESGVYTPERFRLHVQSLQDIVRGYRPQSVYTYAARPGVGKSSYLHNEAAHIAAQLTDGRRALLYSLEMPVLQVADGLVASRARMNVQAISDRRMRPDMMRVYSRAAGEVAKLPLDVDDKTRYWEDMVTEIRTRAIQGTLSVVLIDYLSLVKTRRTFKGDSATRLRINYVMEEAKSLAMETNAVIVFAAQFNRAGDGAPSLVHLKESGGIEEHSDAVIGIDRDMTEATSYTSAIQPARLIVLKHRHGPMGTANAGYYGAYKLFVDIRREGNEHAAD